MQGGTQGPRLMWGAQSPHSLLPLLGEGESGGYLPSLSFHILCRLSPKTSDHLPVTPLVRAGPPKIPPLETRQDGWTHRTKAGQRRWTAVP